jgi:hypothetical protein
LFQRTFLTGFAFALLAAQACGSDDGKKHVEPGEAGMGGEAGQAPEPSAGGSSAGAPSPGIAGEAPTPIGGVGGQAPVEPMGGAGGEPPLPVVPKPELLFSVKPGAQGLDDTAINGSANPENAIYTSKTGSQVAVDGTNEVKITGESLGLAATDQIVAFAIMQATPQNPTYLFSVSDGAEGAQTTRIYEEYWENNGIVPIRGDVYYSDGEQSFRDNGEGGDLWGYHAMLATERSLGLSFGQNEANYDDLTGLAVHDANIPITELYFTVNADAAGAADSAVAATGWAERSCTVFKSALDGTNTVAFTCAALGLSPGEVEISPDAIDALAIYGTTQPTSVLFSVTVNSRGAAASAVATASASLQAGASLFESPGDGSNTLLKAARDLGLGEHTLDVLDELDGLAVIDAPKAKVASAGSCQLTYDPLDTVGGGALANVTATSHLGTNVLVVAGPANGTARLVAYNATTCAFLQQVDVPPGFENPATTVIVPLAGWSATKPLEKVEYLRVAPDGISQALSRYDAAGTFIQAFPIANTEYNGVDGVVYSPAGDQLYVLLNQNGYRKYKVFPRPGADVTSIAVPSFHRTHPCGLRANISGTDAAGNLYLGQKQAYGTNDYRVCAFTPKGELLPAPYAWSGISTQPNYYGGFIVPGGSHFALSKDAAPWVIERGAYQAP